jgi:hypothetical protein
MVVPMVTTFAEAPAGIDEAAPSIDDLSCQQAGPGSRSYSAKCRDKRQQHADRERACCKIEGVERHGCKIHRLTGFPSVPGVILRDRRRLLTLSGRAAGGTKKTP